MHVDSPVRWLLRRTARLEAENELLKAGLAELAGTVEQQSRELLAANQAIGALVYDDPQYDGDEDFAGHLAAGTWPASARAEAAPVPPSEPAPVPDYIVRGVRCVYLAFTGKDMPRD